MLTITLPWPPAMLSPNDRPPHWAVLYRAKKAYREACYWQAMEQGVRPNQQYKPPLTAVVEYYPPDRRKRNRDNMIGASKSGLDGLADALGVPDEDWILTFEFPEDSPGVPTIGGMLKVLVTEAI